MARRSPLSRLLALPLVALLGLAAVPGTAPALEPSDLIHQVEAKYKGVTSLEADFTQVSHNANFGDETVKGKVTVKRPGKMRWAFGNEKFFITDGKKMWIYTVEDKQVIQYDDVSSQRASADMLLSSMDQLEAKYAVKVLSSTATGHVVELTPKGQDQFKKVRLEIDAKLVPTKVAITDTFDNVTEISFANVSLNKPADDTLFTFSVPSGVDVIKAN